MRSTRIALCAAIATVTFWAVKSVAIGMAGGLDKSPLEAPMFFLGLVSHIVAVVALGVALTDGSRTWVRVIAGIGAPVVGVVLTLVVDGVVSTFHEPGPERHWAWSETNLWIVSLTVLALTWTLASRRRQPLPPGEAVGPAESRLSAGPVT